MKSEGFVKTQRTWTLKTWEVCSLPWIIYRITYISDDVGNFMRLGNFSCCYSTRENKTRSTLSNLSTSCNWLQTSLELSKSVDLYSTLWGGLSLILNIIAMHNFYFFFTLGRLLLLHTQNWCKLFMFLHNT